MCHSLGKSAAHNTLPWTANGVTEGKDKVKMQIEKMFLSDPFSYQTFIVIKKTTVYKCR